MARFTLTTLTAALALAACSPAAPPAREAEGDAEIASEASLPDPAATIRPLYDRYLSNNLDFPEFEDAAPWTSDLRARIVAMEARSQAEGGPILDFDPIVNAQDWQLSDLNVATEAVARDSHAVVRARFNNGGAPVEVIYDLVWVGGQWRIDNIRGPEFDLRQTISAPG